MQKGLDYGKELKFLHDFFFIDGWGPTVYSNQFMPIIEVTLNTMVNDLFDLRIPVKKLDVPVTILVPGGTMVPKPTELHGELLLDKYHAEDFVGLYYILLDDIRKYCPIMVAPITALISFYASRGNIDSYKRLVWVLAELTFIPLTDKRHKDMVEDIQVLFHSWDDDVVNSLLEMLGGQNDNLGEVRYTQA